MSESPAVSCLMAAHNAERYLADAVRSVLAQTAGELELIVVDDGSDDATPQLLADFAARDNRVRILRQSNQGLTRSLNVAAAAARGPFLARMDADDIACPKRFAEQLHFLQMHPTCVAVGCALTLIDPDGDTLANRPVPATHEAIVAELDRGVGAIPHPTAMIRRSAFEHLGGYCERFAAAQDLDLWLRMAETGQLANLAEPLLRYRLHAESVTTRKRQLQLACAELAVREARRRRGDPDADAFRMSGSAPTSRVRTLRGWARMALKSRLPKVARKHAWSAFRDVPWWPAHWWLLARTYF